MFKRIIACVLSTVICSSAPISAVTDRSAWAVTTDAPNDATLVYDENIPQTEDNASVKATIKNVPDISNIIETAKLGENITAYIYNNGLLRICGYGDMTDFNKPPFQKAAEVKQILFEDKDAENGLVLTRIGNYAFSGMEKLNCSSCGSADKAVANLIVLPDTIKSIGECAFSGCSDIITVTVPDSVDIMEGKIFKDCKALKELTLPYAANLLKVANGEKTFSNTSVADLFMESKSDWQNQYMSFSDYAIEKITITGGECIPEYAFSGMTTVKEIDLSGTKASSLDSYAFNNCTSLESLKLPSTIKTIGSYAFSNCTKMKAFNLNEGIEKIEEGAFYNCTGIHSLTIPETVTSMGKKMLNGCFLLETLTLPYAATSSKVANGDEISSDTSVADLFMFSATDFPNQYKSFSDYGILTEAGEYEIVLNTDDKEFGGFGLVDDSTNHLTMPGDAPRPDGKEWLLLYLPSRSACVLRLKGADDFE